MINSICSQNDINILTSASTSVANYAVWRAEMELIEKGSNYRLAFGHGWSFKWRTVCD